MRHFNQKIFLFFIIAAFLNACALFKENKEEQKKAICKELNRQIVNNGATGNQTLATQQRAESEILNQDYRSEDCDAVR